MELSGVMSESLSNIFFRLEVPDSGFFCFKGEETNVEAVLVSGECERFMDGFIGGGDKSWGFLVATSLVDLRGEVIISTASVDIFERGLGPELAEVASVEMVRAELVPLDTDMAPLEIEI